MEGQVAGRSFLVNRKKKGFTESAFGITNFQRHSSDKPKPTADLFYQRQDFTGQLYQKQKRLTGKGAKGKLIRSALQQKPYYCSMTYNLEWLVQQYASFFEKFGISRDDLIAHYVIWREKTSDASVTNYLWYLFQVLLGETQKQISHPGDYHRNLHDIYLMMLAFRVKVEGQKDNNLVQLIIKNRIQLWQQELH